MDTRTPRRQAPHTAEFSGDFSWLNTPRDTSADALESLYALELDQWLWRGQHESILPLLKALLADGPPREKAAAGWVLARWALAERDFNAGWNAIKVFHASADGPEVIDHPGPFLLGIDLAVACEEYRAAHHLLVSGMRRFDNQADFILARFQLAKAQGAEADELAKILGNLHALGGLSPITIAEGQGPLFDRLRGTSPLSRCGQRESLPLVSVIVPTYNAEAFLPVALHSLLAQSWPRLEVLVVDDSSTDDSALIAQQFAANDQRVRVIPLTENEGAYSARNAGFAEATGAFITVHDADDWSHPQKVESQVRPLLEDNKVQATVSHWVRTGNDLSPTAWRIEKSWINRNVSSLMVRAELRETLGYWDRTRVNSDTEYYYRIVQAYGRNAISEVFPGIPLAFGRTLPESLTNRSATHLRTQLHGIRHDHMEAAHEWHRRAARPRDLFLPQHPSERPFLVPEPIAIGDTDGLPTDYDIIFGSQLMDAEWYLRANPDVLQTGMGAARHYLLIGAQENRDPGPLFSSSGYRHANGLTREENPLLHYLQQRHGSPTAPLPRIPGRLSGSLPAGKTVLVFAHTSGQTLFGAERSFLAMLERLVRDGFAPVAVLPGLHNDEYLAQVLEMSAMVEVLPQLWRNGLYPPNTKTVATIRALIKRYEAREVHVNTLVLEAPLIAARAEAVPSVVFVRELPAEDPSLCRSLAIGPETLRYQLLQQADRFLMPSQPVADWLGCADRCTVRYNAIDETLFNLPYAPGRVLNVAMISSNIIKKGIEDFVTAARMISAMGQPICFRLIGPQTQDLQRLQPIPPNLHVCDYAPTPTDAIGQADIVVSLSHFAESFGRTVVEAMAAGRPVICYNRGAPPSLVVHSKTGLVIPAGSIPNLVDAVLALDAARLQLAKMSLAARERAREIQAQALV